MCFRSLRRILLRRQLRQFLTVSMMTCKTMNIPPKLDNKVMLRKHFCFKSKFFPTALTIGTVAFTCLTFIEISPAQASQWEGLPGSEENEESSGEGCGWGCETGWDPPNPTATPEPLTIFGAATAAGFGAFFKRKLKGKQDKD